ncbi:hypothetical protein DPMN_038518 [Dreissena polymorpha]|uniref:Uncharacterized protein n=1 Tax=Dreissena polymorpha TaxID=45954 RepID=A0A9D4MD98_DREPO|nr:hypothetical protein DPMN_038518 [Dreissena polymorpha]
MKPPGFSRTNQPISEFYGDINTLPDTRKHTRRGRFLDALEHKCANVCAGISNGSATYVRTETSLRNADMVDVTTIIIIIINNNKNILSLIIIMSD